MADTWNDLSTDEKLEALRAAAKDRADQCNQIAARLAHLEQRVTAQILPMVDQIGDLTSRLAALETAAETRKG